MTYRAERLAELRRKLLHFHTQAGKAKTLADREPFLVIANETTREIVLLLTKRDTTTPSKEKGPQ